LWKCIGKISADGGGLGHYGVAMPKRRHLAHGIDCEIGRRLHGGAVVEHFGAVGLADLFEHPAHDAAA
jgi:hypothetical protein